MRQRGFAITIQGWIPLPADLKSQAEMLNKIYDAEQKHDASALVGMMEVAPDGIASRQTSRQAEPKPAEKKAEGATEKEIPQFLKKDAAKQSA